jgi:hypothetical protein
MVDDELWLLHALLVVDCQHDEACLLSVFLRVVYAGMFGTSKTENSDCGFTGSIFRCTGAWDSGVCAAVFGEAGPIGDQDSRVGNRFNRSHICSVGCGFFFASGGGWLVVLYRWGMAHRGSVQTFGNASGAYLPNLRRWIWVPNPFRINRVPISATREWTFVPDWSRIP